MNFPAAETALFFLTISVLLFFARAIGEFAKYFKQPIVIGEIIAGIVLGPTILGTIFPEIFNKLFSASPVVLTALQGLVILGVVMLLLVSGLEIDISLVVSQGKTAFLISTFSIIVPFAVGFLAAYYYPHQMGIKALEQRLVFALFVGTALSITALPVVVRTLMDLNLYKSEIGFLIIASAMFNDLVGWIVFSVILGMIGQNSHGADLTTLIISVISFVIFMLLIGRKIINYVIPFIIKRTSQPGGLLNFIFILAFLGAALTEYIGIHAIFGAFIVGIAIGDSTHLKEETREIIHQFVTNIFAPLFFISIGLHVNFVENFDLEITLVFLVLAFIGKVLGGGLGAYLSGISKNESIAIGFGMNSRGAMEIVLGSIAYQSGLIHEKVFVALIIMAIVTSISSAPLLNYFLKKSKKTLTFPDLIRAENILFSAADTKHDVIKELCDVLSQNNNLSAAKLLREVLEREKIISTGLEKHLAIPHAKINIKNPLVAIAVHRDGVDFECLDGLPAKLIILLVTPKNEPEIQLNLLGEITHSFGEIQKIEKLISSKNSSELIHFIKSMR